MIKDFTAKVNGKTYNLISELVSYNGESGAIWRADLVTRDATYTGTKKAFVSAYIQKHESNGMPKSKAKCTRADVLEALGL